ncbi:MAG: NTP transferase domain-containing protein, partial [Aeriscardovia sp.]|nr:NTP transferase domain-containing protein [Aeriscardovia sp.]
MKALILNSGLGHRMGVITKDHPKCMTEISHRNTILSRQLRQLVSFGIEEVVMTTGYYDKVLLDYCNVLHLPLKFTFVNNPLYADTNYIYSIYCAKDYLKEDDVLLMHGDLVFENLVLEAVISFPDSCMAVSSTLPLPKKDFKAVVKDGKIEKVGIDFFDDAMAAQPLYKIQKDDWLVWLANIEKFCESDNRKCYAENAFNEVSDSCKIYPCDVKNMLCAEIDTPEDLEVVSKKVAEINERTVYMCFSTEYIHSGHIAIINKARRLGRLIVGVLSDEVVSSFKRFPLIPFEERKALFENLAGVERVVTQDTLSYAKILRDLKPDYVVHGNDWCEGFQKPIRQEVCDVLAEYGGQLIEYQYSDNPMYKELDANHRAEAAMPDVRRGRLRKLISMKGLVTAMEAHSGITGLIVEKTT